MLARTPARRSTRKIPALQGHGRQAVTCIRHRTPAGPGGRALAVASRKPLFHLEHAAVGGGQAPLNLWRIDLD